MNLRSNFERGSTRWAVRRAQWLAMGIPEEDFEKPKIAVVNSSSSLSVCYIHLDDVSRAVQKSIRASGGLPFEIRTAAPSDFITSGGLKARYLLPTRDLVVNDIEVQVEGACLDAMVLLSSCDKTTPAHLMAAARLNIPSIVVTLGTLTIYRGATFVISGGAWVNADKMSPDFIGFQRAVFLGIPVLSWIAVLAAVGGFGATIMMAAALMGLVFLSSGSGHDEDVDRVDP